MTIIATFGVWDLFHIGHLNLLEKAKGLGDKLIVGIATDELIESYKGKKAIIPYRQRKRIIDAIRYVDLTVPYSKLDITELLGELSVDILVVGGDWGKLEGQQRYKKYMLERGRFVILPYTEGISTTRIKEQMTDRIIEDINES